MFGIAFAPPHAISTPRTSPSGTVIAPAPPRTGTGGPRRPPCSFQQPLIHTEPGGTFMGTTDDRIAAAPLPTTRTLRRRSSIPRQIWRFGQINLCMLRMVRKAH